MKVVATNRSARRDYEVVEAYEAGIVLTGSEVKSLRGGEVSIAEAYGIVRDGEIWLVGMFVAPYSHARDGGHEPHRDRKLLLHKREIQRIASQLAERGLTLVPVRVFFRDGIAKLEMILGRGRPRFDKRRLIKEREQEREMQRAQRHRGRRA